MAYGNSDLALERSRQLRKNSTEEEKSIWFEYLRKCEWKFRRQHVIMPYILDFYCIKLGLAIEIDGTHHHDKEVEEYDARRTKFLESKGIRVLRIDNYMVSCHLPTAVQMIEDEIDRIARR